MKSESTFKRRLTDFVTMFLMSGLSLVLLIYIGFGEAQRTYQEFHVEKLMAQGKVIQNAMEIFLRPGLPMKQFVGFATLTEPILNSDNTIAGMTAFDRSGRPVFASGTKSIPLLPEVPSAGKSASQSFELRQNRQYIQVVLPLRSRFEAVGSLAVTLPRSVVTDRVQASFQPLLIVALIFSFAFALFVTLGGPRLKGRRTPMLQLVYAITFVSMAIFVVGTLISLYSEGAQAKTQALADSLGQRLAEIIEFNLNIDEIHGLDRTFGNYIQLNPDISAAGLTINGLIHIHTDPGEVGKPWVTNPHTYEYVVNLTPPDSVRNIRVAVALPTGVVYRQIARSVKNFAALFVASAFLSGLFLQLAGSMQRANSLSPGLTGRPAASEDDDWALHLVKPVFFVAIFLEHLNYAFLPQFMYQVVANSGLSDGYASAPFTAYYLCFALALIPAGHFAQHNSTRPLMYLGLLLAGAGLVLMAVSADFIVVLLARSMSGIGQGMLFIGVQSYILAVASPGRKTRGAAIIVFGFQGGMISGMAIGSLLVNHTGPQGVFILSGVIAYALAMYAMFVVPAAGPEGATGVRVGFTLGQLARNLGKVLRSFEFLRTMLLIGVPAKAVLTGIVIFALPLLLAQKQYVQEDIGQIIMVYAAGVVLASGFASRLVDRSGRTYGILFWGSALSGLGLLLIAMIDWAPLAASPFGSTTVTVILILGVATLGVAHGFINAPVVTHVAESELATNVGASSLTATYRFLERLGHIAGPIIVGQLFLFWGQNALILAWVGAAILIFGLLFLFPVTPGQDNTANREIV